MTTQVENHVTLYIPTPLRAYTNHQATVHLTGDTVGEVLTLLVDQFPLLKTHLYNEEGVLRSFINIYHNDEDIRRLQGVDTPVTSKDTLSIVPSIAGG